MSKEQFNLVYLDGTLLKDVENVSIDVHNEAEYFRDHNNMQDEAFCVHSSAEITIELRDAKLAVLLAERFVSHEGVLLGIGWWSKEQHFYQEFENAVLVSWTILLGASQCGLVFRATLIQPAKAQEPEHTPDKRLTKEQFELLELIEHVWENHPNLRLMQLLGNCWAAGEEGTYHVSNDKLREVLRDIYDYKDENEDYDSIDWDEEEE